MVHDAAQPEPPVEEATPAEAAAPEPELDTAALLAAERVANDYHPGRRD